MAGKVLQLEDLISEDQLGCQIATKFQEWDDARNPKKAQWQELYQYIYATDTRTTSNATLPWKNSTTTPKLTQIRDNLHANYMASMFPRRRYIKWEGSSREDQTKEKVRAVTAYTEYMINYPGFKDTVSRLVLDYIDFGNVFAGVDWLDERVDNGTKIQSGYHGPVIQRYSPYDIVMNPVAPDFYRAPKIVRSIVSLGEVEEYLQRLSTNDGERAAYEELFKYLIDIRGTASSFKGNISVRNKLYSIDGFGSYQQYLTSGQVEVLTFYGDFYDVNSGQFLKNHIIQVVDRHKIIRNAPNPSDIGTPPIFHSGWRLRQDNLWAMGPLDNIVGMQYRLDHIENLKADFFDIVYAPPLKISGYVEDFKWAPFEKIHVGDEGDVELMSPQINPLQANFELDRLENQMEQMVGAPKEAMGFRTPGEKTAYEVQRLENAAARIFQNKIAQFEEQILEPLLNAMLELARRKMDDTTVRVLNDDTMAVTFRNITADDLAGSGRLRPIAARHFAEVAERVQNITTFYSTGPGADPEVRQHISSIETAKLFEELLDLSEFHLVEPYIRLTEQAEGQQMAGQLEEDTLMGMATPSGLTPDDTDIPFA